MSYSKSDAVKCIVNSYLKKRQYYDNDKKGEMEGSRNADSSIIAATVEAEASLPNSILYTNINSDPTVVKDQFSKFKSWVNGITSSKTGEELRQLLFPLLCHFYIEMLLGGHKDAALSFLKDHQPVGSDEEFLLLQELSTIGYTSKIDEKEVSACLRSLKYQVILSPTALQMLQQYLIKKAHVILLKTVNSWFDLEERKSLSDIHVGVNDDEPVTQFSEELTFPPARKLVYSQVQGCQDAFLLYSVHAPEDRLTCGTVSVEKTLLAGGHTTCEIRLWSLNNERKLRRKEHCPGSKIRLAIDVDDENREELVFGDDEAVNVNYDTIFRDSDALVLRGHSGVVQDTAFIPFSDILVSVSMDKTMKAWNLENYTCAATYRGHNYPVWCVTVSPLAGFVVTGSHDRTARLWCLERNYPLRIFAGHQQDIDCARFHPNGNYVATGSSDNSVRLWSVDSGELVRVFDGHRAGVMALAFSPDGNYLASAGDDKRVKLWDLRKSCVSRELRGHSDTVLSIDWSPNGEFISSCSMDHTARIWSAKTSEDDSAGSTPMIYNLNCNNICSIRYTSSNTPICVVSVGT